jgi:hypothetical protein
MSFSVSFFGVSATVGDAWCEGQSSFLRRSQSLDEAWDADDIDCASEIVRQHAQRCFGSDFLKAACEEVSLMPGMFERTKGMFTEAFALLKLGGIVSDSLPEPVDNFFMIGAIDPPAVFIDSALAFRSTRATRSSSVHRCPMLPVPRRVQQG